MSSESLGKLVSVHPVASSAVQRVIVVAVFSFLFFVGTFFAFYLSGRTVFFLLSTGFLVIYVLTMLGWFALRRIEVRLFEDGLIFKKAAIRWETIDKVERMPKKGVRLDLVAAAPLVLPESLSDIDKIEAFVRSRLSNPVR